MKIRPIRKKIFKATSQAIAYALVFSLLCPAQAIAARSRAGGGEIKEPDWGQVATNIGVTVGCAMAGSALSSAWGAAAPANTGATTIGRVGQDIAHIPATLGNLVTNTAGVAGNTAPLVAAATSFKDIVPIVVTGYSTYTAGTQVSRAIGMAGQYYEWNPSTTYALSYMGTGMTAGFLNPKGALGNTFDKAGSYGGAMVRGAFVGGLAGYPQGLMIHHLASDEIEAGKSPGISAQLAGMAVGMVATEFGRALVNPDTWKMASGAYHKENLYDFGNAKTKTYRWQTHDGQESWVSSDDPQLEIISPEEIDKMRNNPGIRMSGDESELQVTAGRPLGEYWVKDGISSNDDALSYRQMKDAGPAKNYTLNHEMGEGSYINTDNGKMEVITADRYAQLKDDPSYRVTSDPGQLEVTKLEESWQPHADGGRAVVPAGDIGRMQGRDVLAAAAKDNRAYFDQADRITDGSMGKLLSDNRTQISSNGSGVDVAVPGNDKAPEMSFSLSRDEYNFARNSISGLNGPDSMVMPTGVSPTAGQVASRILVNPFIRVADQWPVFAAKALALNVYDKIDEDEKSKEWAPVLSNIVFSTSMSLLDTAATAWSLKPSLRWNTDAALGLLPETRYQQQALFNKAAVHHYASEVAKLPEEASTKDIQAMLGRLKFSEKEQEHILKAYGSDAKGRLQQTEDLARLIHNEINSNREAVIGIDRLHRVGGNRTEVMLAAAWNSLRYDLPLNLVSGYIDIEVDRHIKDDQFEEVLGRAAASSVIRGAVWGLYSEAVHAEAMKRMKSGQLNPEQIATGVNLQDPVEIMFERRSGNLPLPDPRRFVVVENGRIFAEVNPNTKKFVQDPETGKVDAYFAQDIEEELIIPLVWEASGEGNVSVTSLRDSNNADLETIKNEFRQLKIQDKEFRERLNNDPVLNEKFERLMRLELQAVAIREAKEGDKVTSSLDPDLQLGNSKSGIYTTGVPHPGNRMSGGIEEWWVPNGLDRSEVNSLIATVNGALDPNVRSIDAFGPKDSLKDLQKKLGQMSEDPDFMARVDQEAFNQLMHLRQTPVGFLRPQDQPMRIDRPGSDVMVLPALTVHGNNITRSGFVARDEDGKLRFGQRHNLPEVPSLTSAMLGSFSQAMSEFGWQSLAMGLPYTKDGKMSAYVWNNYVWSSNQSLHNLVTSAAGQGIFKTMGQYSTMVGKDVISRSFLTSLPDAPYVNDFLGLAPFVAVQNYKGMPFGLALQVETGFKSQFTQFVPVWPYPRLNVVPHDSFWRNIKMGIGKQITGHTVLPTDDDYEVDSAGRNPVVPNTNPESNIEQPNPTQPEPISPEQIQPEQLRQNTSANKLLV